MDVAVIRDVTKRSDIAKTVSDYSNLQIITDDNPRTENPKKIRDFLLKNPKMLYLLLIGRMLLSMVLKFFQRVMVC